MINHDIIGNNMKLFFARNQGLRVGESAVVSRKVHQPAPKPGHIQVLIDQDAGRGLLGLSEPNQAVHIDVYHEAAEIDVLPLARRIYRTIQHYLAEREQQTTDVAMDRFTHPTELAHRIVLGTGCRQGRLSDILRQRAAAFTEIDETLTDHVHILVDIPESCYGLIYLLIDAAEEEIIAQGGSICRVAGFCNQYSRTANNLRINSSVIDYFRRRRAS